MKSAKHGTSVGRRRGSEKSAGVAPTPLRRFAVVRLTVGLRSPLAFQLPGRRTGDWLKAPPDTVGIEFEGREFVWHPPTEHGDELGRSQYGPMVAVLITDDEDGRLAARSLQRFLSAAAFAYEEPVDDGSGGLGGDGEPDAYHPFGARAQRSHPYVRKAEAPAALVVQDHSALRLALSYFREGLNASSPFYRCVAFRNVLDAVYEVEHETAAGAPTPEAAARDAFIDAMAANVAGWYSMTTPARGWADYLREEVRNALAHVNRMGRREVNPDDPVERVRLRQDATVMRQLAKAAIEQRWPYAITRVPR
jgi:hypothetical protein